MPLSRENLVACANKFITQTDDELKLLQLSALADSDTVFSVATIGDLPDASLNKGRFVYVESVGSYRFSDGLEWTNDYDTNLIITLYGWGFNSGGQIGDNTIVDRSSPNQEITSSTNWCQISSGGEHSSAIKTNGTLWAWGCNITGELGDGTTIGRSSPVQEISSSTNWDQVSVGNSHISAIKTSGTLWAWGCNITGSLGDGTSLSRCSPVQEISSSTDWCMVSSGFAHSSALKTSGEIWSWGINSAGRLGDGTSISRSSPVQEISSSTDWCMVSSGFAHSSALKTSGEIWSWGCNSIGQLGSNTKTDSSSPVQEISSSIDWCQIDSGWYHTAALKTSGEIWSWGFNPFGQLGNGTSLSRCSPVQEITSSTNWCQVSGSSVHSSAIKTNGTLWGWGCNAFGNLGDGTSIIKSSPVQEISSSTNWGQVSGGGFHSLALKVEKGFI